MIANFVINCFYQPLILANTNTVVSHSLFFIAMHINLYTNSKDLWKIVTKLRRYLNSEVIEGRVKNVQQNFFPKRLISIL